MGRISDRLEGADFENRPNTVQIQLAGETLPWYLGRVTFDLCEQHEDEVDFANLLSTAMSLSGDDVRHNFDVVGRIAWAGLLPFEEDLEYDVVAQAMSFEDMGRFAQLLRNQFTRLQELSEQDGEGDTPSDTPLENTPAGKG